MDYASTTPVDKRVLREMRSVEKIFANPSSLYGEALLAKEKINLAKKTVADILNCSKDNIVFTSGGTESNNLALLGVFENLKTKDFIPHFITTNIEHPAILEVFSEIEKRGGEVTYISVKENGVVEVKDIEKALKENTVLVSVMYANNEIGTVAPIKEIGRMIKEWRREQDTVFPYLHTDACQAALYLSLDVLKLNVDLLTLDGIKMHGPRGVGILYVKSGVKISPIIFGGGQQGGLRSGTENIGAFVGFAKALEIGEEVKEGEVERLLKIRDYAIGEILKYFPKASLNGDRASRLPNNINICFPGIDSEFTTIALDVAGVLVSYSSSCRTLKEDSSSYVISNLGKEGCSLSSLRFTLGRETKKGDIDFLVKKLRETIK